MLVITGVILCIVVLFSKAGVVSLGASDATKTFSVWTAIFRFSSVKRIHDGLAWHERVHQCARLCEPRHADGPLSAGELLRLTLFIFDSTWCAGARHLQRCFRSRFRRVWVVRFLLVNVRCFV